MIKTEYYGVRKFYFKVCDTDEDVKDHTYIWVVQGSGTDEQYWDVGFWRNHTALGGVAHNVTLRHGIKYIETVVDIIKWYNNHQS